MLGAGFKIAMRDLEIRGAGNLLGAEQSGHIAAVGYEMYCRLLEDAVKDLTRDPDEQPVSQDGGRHRGHGVIPRAYIPSEPAPDRGVPADRHGADGRDLDRVRDDLTSAYGEPPKASSGSSPVASHPPRPGNPHRPRDDIIRKTRKWNGLREDRCFHGKSVPERVYCPYRPRCVDLAHGSPRGEVAPPSVRYWETRSPIDPFRRTARW
jgi:hypothetical protein